VLRRELVVASVRLMAHISKKSGFQILEIKFEWIFCIAFQFQGLGFYGQQRTLVMKHASGIERIPIHLDQWIEMIESKNNVPRCWYG
jgi:hypothetical protein